MNNTKLFKYFTFLLFNIIIMFTMSNCSEENSGSNNKETSAKGMLVFQTDFENTEKDGEHHLNLSIDTWFEYGGDGGARMWVEGVDQISDEITCHSGSRCIGMELTDITKSRRSEFVIFPQSLVGDELFVSGWYYLPSDWGLHAPDIDWNWYGILQITHNNPPDYWPYIQLEIYDNAIGGGYDVFDVGAKLRDPDGIASSLGGVENFTLPRGKWFNIKWYLLRHKTNGKIRIWVDEQLILDKSVISTKHIDDYYIEISKIYHETTDTTTHQIWFDDLEIYDNIP